MAAPHNELELGNPLGTSTGLPGREDANEPAPLSPGAARAADPSSFDSRHAPSVPTNSPHPYIPSGIATTQHPTIRHTRTAPTTVPIVPVAFLPETSVERDNVIEEKEEAGSQSSSATLNNSSSVPLAAGGLHGEPLPGSKHADGEFHEKDHQAGTTGGRTGATIAEKAAATLGLAKGGSEWKEKRDQLTALQPPPDKSRKIVRTATGTRITRKVQTSEGGETVSGFGMVPVTRQISLPPGVGPFGGAAPSGEDAEMGLSAVRSHEEELERQEDMKKKGPDPFAVRFDSGEKENPKNWGVGYRWYLTGVAGLLVLNSTFASSAPSGIVTSLIDYFEFSQEVAILTIALFVAGYCLGPLLWGPLSESYGRRPIFLMTFIVYTGFQVGCALSQNTASILIFRFLGGTFASAPLTNSGALLADIWDADHRGQAMCVFALAPFAGPSIGPIVSGYIEVAGVSWRWVFWILTIFAGFCFFVILFTVPETYAPALLVMKAKRLRKETGDDRYYAPLERTSHKLSDQINTILLKPFIMLVQEPMLLAVTLYMSFVYGVVYLLFEAFPFVFVINHGFNSGENGLAFLAFFFGGFLCVLAYLTIVEPRYQKYSAKMAPLPPQPEKRLEMTVITAWCLVVAMFWFGWTSYPSIHWISPVLAAVLLGVGVLGMFVTLFNYIIDVYLWSAASALSASTVCRSAFGAGFPLFATQMYSKLGTQWASSLLGFLALLMAPIPMVLIKFGPTLRKRSKFSPDRPE